MLDKGCSAEEKMITPDGFNFLQKCFPSVDATDLQEVLTRCEGDLQWATNILLDSSLEYNEPASAVGGPVNGRVSTASTSKQIVQRSSGESPSSNSGKELVSPPPLAVLCHSSMPSGTELSSNNMQQTFVHASVRRIKSIEEFKRQHSIPSESHDGGVDRASDLSMVNPYSSEGTLKDEVFETLFRQKISRPTSVTAAERTLSESPPYEEDGSSVDAKPSDSPAGQDEIDGQLLEPSTPSAVDIDEVIEEELKEAQRRLTCPWKYLTH